MERAEAERQRAETEQKRDCNTIGATAVAMLTVFDHSALEQWRLAALGADGDEAQGVSADSEGAFRRSDEAVGDAHETPPPLYGDPEPAPAEEDGEMTEEEVADKWDSLEPAQRQRQQEWLSMFQIRARPQNAGVPEQDRLATWAAGVAPPLRAHPIMPADPADAQKPWLDVSGGGRLPPVSCAFAGCPWYGGHHCEGRVFRKDPEHPWDQELRTHVLAAHAGSIAEAGKDLSTQETLANALWDVYIQAIAVVERRGILIVGLSVDRRATEHVVQRYNDQRTRVSMCFCCAQVKTDTGGCRCDIEFTSGSGSVESQ